MFLSNEYVNPKFIVCLLAATFSIDVAMAETQNFELKNEIQDQLSDTTVSETVEKIEKTEAENTSIEVKSSTESDSTIKNSDYLISYVPPVRGGESERIPTTARGGECPRFKGDKDFALHALAPTHLAQTTKAQPILYWSLSKPISAKFAFTLEEEFVSGKKIPTQLIDDEMIDLSLQAGIHAFPLSKYNIVLKEGVEYNWFVSLICDVDRRSLDIIAGGRIMRIEPSAKFSMQEKQTSHEKLPHLYAESSLWYDALESLARWIKNHQKEKMPHQLRVDLLKQVKLPEVTVHDKVQ